MSFHLVHGWGDLIVQDQIHEAVWVEIRHTHRAGQALLVDVLQSAPGTIDVTHGLVDQVKVQVIQAQAFQGTLKSSAGGFLAGVLNPHLASDEQFVAGNAAGCNGTANGFFISVRGRSVNGAVPKLQSFRHHAFAFAGFGELIHAKTKDGHLDAVIQGYGLHTLPFYIKTNGLCGGAFKPNVVYTAR